MALWVALSILGISYWSNISFTILPRWSASAELLQLIASTLVAVLVAIVPVSSTAWLHSEWERRRRLDDPDLPRRPIGILVIVVVASLLTSLLPAAIHVFFTSPVKGVIIALPAALASLIGIAYLMGACYRRGKGALILTLLWIATIWLLPLLIDLTRYQMLRSDYQNHRRAMQPEPAVTTFISGISPIGTLLFGYAEGGGYRDWAFNPVPGLVIQFAFAAAMMGLYHAVGSKAKTSTRPGSQSTGSG